MIRLGNRLVNQYEIVRVIKGDDFLRVTMSDKQELHWDVDDLSAPDHEFSVQLQSLDWHIAHHDFIEYSDGMFLGRGHVSWIRFKRRSIHFHMKNGQRFAVFNQVRVKQLREDLEEKRTSNPTPLLKGKSTNERQ